LAVQDRAGMPFVPSVRADVTVSRRGDRAYKGRSVLRPYTD